ncbi:CHAT domain-containing protein [Ornithinimicrobium cerasi]|uniref:CHAT domain-containing protein n=1 Tax=Ornithinimicrobium cerasi TaxID=2248773 RepID=A0A285VJ20_9MICO|nr:CHAT domain-containing protein [Ornithinimicrobium cerasi]SOC52541.1 CHAT domain-containing protein [Ornithinimicrobium cerasi]
MTSGTRTSQVGAPVPPGVTELFERGRQANSAGRPALGERLLRQALSELDHAGVGDRPEVVGFRVDEHFPSVGGGPADALEARVRVLLSLSTAVVDGGGPAPAVRLAHQALTRAGRTAEGVRPALVALCHAQLATLHGRAGRLRTALAELDLAAAGRDRLGPREKFGLLLSSGALRMEVPDAGGAAAEFAAAAQLAAEHGLPAQEFMALHNLGSAAALEGDLPKALSLMLKADRLPTDVSRAVAWHGRALVLLEAGLVTEAVELLERATAEALEDGQRLEAGHCLNDQALGELLLGEPEAAVATAGRAAQTLAGGGAPGLRRRASLVELSARLRTGSAPGRVASRCVRLAEEFDRDGDNVAADLARLLAAEALTARGRHTEAVGLLDASAELTRVGSLSTRMRTRAVLAAADRSRGDVAAARRHVRAALRDLSAALSASASLELRSVTLTHATGLSRLDLELAGENPAARLRAVERWREVAWRVPEVRPPADPELARRVTNLRHLRQQAREDPQQAGRLRERLRSLERQVAAASWAAAGGSGTERAHVPLARVREALAARAATGVGLVEHRSHLAAVVVLRRRTRWVDLGPAAPVREAVQRLAADLEARARVGTGPMVNAVDAALRASARAVDDLLLRPLGVDGRLVVAPVPALAGLAWGVLPSRAGLPTTVAPSLGTWVRGTRSVSAPQAQVIAGPGLPGARQECAAVGAVWGTPAPTALASAEDLAGSLSRGDLTHVAAHGSHRSDSPLFSSLWLEDGPVFLADLERVERTASHVVVSACEAGRAHARGGDASLGLASGLLALGVPSVVASPCRVPDSTAAALMPRYHRLLADGHEVDEALALAASSCDLPLAGAFVAWGSPWSVRPDGA